MTSLVSHGIEVGIRMLLVFGSTAALAIGITQIARTWRLGSAASNADEVIMRSGITIGVGFALLYAAIML